MNWNWLPKWLRNLFNIKDNDPIVPVDPVKPPESKEPLDDFDITQVVVHAAPANVLQFKKTLTIVDVSIAGQVHWTYDKPCTWPENKWGVGNNWLFKKMPDGKIHGGPGDWLRKGQNYKNAGDFKFEYNGQVIRADFNEEVWIMTSVTVRNNVAHSVEERSQAKKILWTKKFSDEEMLKLKEQDMQYLRENRESYDIQHGDGFN